MVCSYPNFLPILLLFFFISLPISIAHDHKLLNHSISTIFVFGDSTVDPGNNNYIHTIIRSDFPPYGQDFPNHTATGRFTNGKLVTDFIASYLGVKENVPPYLDKSLNMEELMTGVSFASAGSGYDPFTPQFTNVLSIPEQLEYFREYKTRLEQMIGKKKAKSHIQKALYIVSAGTNDFVINYFALPFRRKQYNPTSYQNFLIQNARNLVQGLWDLGAQRIGIVGLPPMGCLPIVLTLNPGKEILRRGCVNSYEGVAIEYNQKLENEMQALQKSFANYGGRIVLVDIYQPLFDLITDYNKFGFEEWSRGCCGTGLLEASFLCNNVLSLVCPDASKYIFWDSIHPTEKTYYLLFKAVRDVVDFMAMD